MTLGEETALDELATLLWLNDVSAGRSHLLLKALPDKEALSKFAEGSGNELRKSLSEGIYKALRSSRKNYERPKFHVLLDWLADGKVGLVSIFDEDYPERLRQIRDPPILLFLRYALPDLARSISIIGTRSPTHRANQFARESARRLASSGITVISGLARGIDTEAHCGALDVGGKTVAVLPGSLDEIYPPENGPLGEDIARNGALVAEVSPLVKVSQRRFVERDRITSGLSRALLVVEAGEDSGSIHQARFAAEQRRPIFTVEPEPTAAHSVKQGYRAMGELGAIPVRSIEELEDALRPIMHSNEAVRGSAAPSRHSTAGLDEFTASPP